MLHDGELGSNGWVIALGAIAPVLLLLIVFEFVVYCIQCHNTVFKKPKMVDSGFFVEVVILLVCVAIAIVLTVMNDGSMIGYIIEWWIFAAIIIGMMVARLIYTSKQIKHHRLSPTVCLEWDINQIAEYLKIKDYQNIIDHCGIKNGNWLHQINDQYHDLHNIICTKSSPAVDQKQRAYSLIADVVVFQEQNVISMFKKKRDYVNALFLDLVSEVQKELPKK